MGFKWKPRPRTRHTIPGKLQCSRCRKHKDKSEFSGEVSAYCRLCQREVSRELYDRKKKKRE